MLEIMEPSDLVVRCEFEREGIVVPEDGRFMGQMCIRDSFYRDMTSVN